MKFFVAMLLSFLLVGCGDVDSKVPLTQTRDDDTFTTKLVFIEPHKIVDFCTKLGVQYDANGCSAFYPDKKHCIIYVMPQRFSEDKERLAIIGHELWHCRYGFWHD